jgi:hypothetical protein
MQDDSSALIETIQEYYCQICGSSYLSNTFHYCLGVQDDGTLRTFGTGATRDTAQDKLDYEGFLSPIVIERFAEYMHQHRIQSDGSLRESDNWQKGIPIEQYMKSMWRHFMDVWRLHRYNDLVLLPNALMEEALCALLFNVMGMLHEVLKGDTDN